jgi:hypothetical protein
MDGLRSDQPPFSESSGDLLMKNFARLAALAAAATFVAAPAIAAPVAADPTAKARARIVKPLTLSQVEDLDFGTIVNGLPVAGTRTITISQAGARGGCDATVVVCSGSPQAAEYHVTGTNQMTVRVLASDSNLRNTTSGGNELLAFKINAPTSVPLGNSGQSGVNFNVGGEITIAESTIGGDYEGDLDVTVDY